MKTIIARIVLHAKSVLGLRELTLARPLGTAYPGAVAVIAREPQHDPIFPPAAMSPPAASDDALPGRRMPLLPRVRRIGWLGRFIITVAVIGGVQYATAAPSTPPAPVAPVNDPARPYFSVLLVSSHGEPLRDIAPGYVPSIFFADAASCMRQARVNVRDMARAGVRGRFLCMYPGEPDDELSKALQENF